MPIYEYRCTSCGHELEALQKFSEPPLATCPACRTESLTKLISAAGFQLKGSGWYATDFKGGGGKPAAPKKDGEGKAEKPAEGKTDAAPAASKSDAAPAPAGGSGASSSCG